MNATINEDNNNQAHRWWQLWLDEIESTQPNLERAAGAARHVAAAKANKAQLRQWLAALVSKIDDPLTCTQCQAQLPDFLAAQVATATAGSSAGTHFVDQSAGPYGNLRTHLALCPYCMQAYAQTAEAMVEAIADSVPVSQSYPTFDTSFLPERTPVKRLSGHPLAGRIELALAAGKRWLRDSAGEILILFGPGLQSEPALSWAVKSADPGTLLAQMVLTEDDLPGWEVTVAAFAQEGDAGLCQLEVALYRSAGTLEAILIRIVLGEEKQEALTDSGGVAIFNDLPTARLGELVVHVGLEGSQLS